MKLSFLCEQEAKSLQILQRIRERSNMSLQNTHFGAAKIKELAKNAHGVFFVGIGGINMSSLAHITHSVGKRVAGSDRMKTALTERLCSEGIEIFYAHDAKNIEGFDLLVYTVAISEDNPEYRAAKERGIPCVSRADYMGYLMSEYEWRIGVSGMHGKSSTTSMCAHVLIEANKDPTVLSGAELCEMGGAYRVGGRKYFLFEACEYMDSFLDFSPTLSVVLNIEMDHVDYFKSMEHIKRSYRSFADIANICVANFDDENVREALEGYGGELITFGIENEADLTAVNIKSGERGYSFDLVVRGKTAEHITLNVAGRHNIYNALATAAALSAYGVEMHDIARALASFSGAARRMEYKGSYGGARIFDDYGHHPTEIKTTLEGVRSTTRGRLFCVFQSHTYSRTAALFEDFADSLAVADRVFITDIYSARETDTLGVTPELFAKKVEKRGVRADAVHSFKEAAARLCAELTHGDIAVVMGAGDVYHTFEYIDFDEV